MSTDVICIGLSVVDYLFLCEDDWHGTVRYAADHLVQGGGMAATAAVTVARLGASAEMWARVGDDPGGKLMLDEFRAEGVDVSQITICPGGTSPASNVAVELPGGQRYITFFPGRGLKADVSELDLSRIDRAGALLADCHWLDAEIPAARRAHAAGVPVCADVEGVREGVGELLAHVDYPVYSLDAVRNYAGEVGLEDALRQLAALGGKAVIVTLGADGCAWLADGRFGRMPAFGGVDVVDTTGCGDVFHGAFALGLARGWAFEPIVRFASATAALKCRALGGRTGIPSCKEVETFLASRE